MVYVLNSEFFKKEIQQVNDLKYICCSSQGQ